jgi:hypothetical protein
VEERMKEPYGEGLASHTDPESCVVSREAGIQLGFAPVELGRLDKGGVPLHVLGGLPGGLLFQNLVKLG